MVLSPELTPMSLLVLLVLSLIWVTWVARIMADHLFSRAGLTRLDQVNQDQLNQLDRRQADNRMDGAPAASSFLMRPERQAEAAPVVPPLTGSIESVQPVGSRDYAVMGTIEALDPVALSLVMHTDEADLRYVVLPDPAMLAGLAHGDRVALQVDGGGRPWLLRKMEPAFSDLLRELGTDGSAGAPSPQIAALSARHGGHAEMDRLAG